MSFTYTIANGDWAHIAPEIIVLLTALVVMGFDMLVPARLRGALGIVAVLGVAIAIGSVLMLYQGGSQNPVFFGMVSSDNIALFSMLIVLTATGVALLYSPGYIERQGVRQQGEYYSLLLLAATGMLLLVAAANLMTIFLGVELLSLPLYILCAFAPGQEPAQESGMKYFLLSSFASGFLLYGMALVYGATGATSLAAINSFVTTHSNLSVLGVGPLLLIGMGLLAVGLTFKVSAIPFHAWTPDVYQGAPTSVTAFMSVGTKTAAFVAMARIFILALGPLATDWQSIIAAIAILTMLGGNILAATQTNVKRLLAYSSIAHAGYLLIAVAIGTLQGLSALLFYLAAYAVMNLAAFGVVLALEREAGAGTDLASFRGLSARRPWLAAVMAVSLFALAGIPGTAGFVAKYVIFTAAFAAGHAELAIVGIAGSMISFYYYLRVIWMMYFVSPDAAPQADDALVTSPQGVRASGLAGNAIIATKVVTVAPPIAIGTAIGLALALLGTFALGIFPEPLLQLARQAAGLP